MPLWIRRKWMKYLQGSIATGPVADGPRYYERVVVQMRTHESARAAPPCVELCQRVIQLAFGENNKI